ncbi:unnamed protein product [Urochloa decumbens]|uniref:F-box domain-containing protein n=1 Tax=Urochloa decumbens TaxID=240449 RepID=A0ABC9GAH5_9POAL
MPLSTHLAAAAAAPLLGRRRRQRRPSEPAPESDWAGLPPELVSCILHRLDPVQIMLGADKVCSSWRRAAHDEPELWRRIDVRGYKALSDRNLIDLNQMAIDAVKRSRGQCQAFCGEGSGLHDDLLRCLADHAPLLKTLILVLCNEVSDQGFMEAIKGFPLLEELELSYCYNLQHKKVFKVVAKECPRLKCLTNRCASSPYYGRDDGEAMAIAKMHELRSLHLVHNGLTNQGLADIVDKCLHLESLDIRNCRNIRMHPKMQARFNTKKILMNYMDDEKTHDSEPGFPNSECEICLSYFRRDNESYPKCYVNDMEATVIISTVRELRSLQLYRNDLTSKGLTAILDKCPHLESLDIWNCLNIVRNNNGLQANCGLIRTNKLATKLLTDYSDPKIFNPEGLDKQNCRNIILNYHNVFGDNTLEAKYKPIIVRKMASRYHRRTKKMVAEIEKYMAKLHINVGNIDFKKFDGAEFRFHTWYNYYSQRHSSMELDYEKFVRGYGYNYYRSFEKFKPRDPIMECSTCLMFEYFAERWGVLNLDDYADYYDPSYGLDGHDETDFGVHDRMISKSLRRYLKME